MPEQVLYVAGIEDAKYQVKFPKEAEDRHFFIGRRLLHYARMLLETPALTDPQKLEVMKRVLLSKMSFVLNFDEGLRHPDQMALTRMLYTFVSQLDVKHLALYAHLMAQTNNTLKAQAEARQMAVAA